MVACTGNKFTHNCTSDWLRDTLTSLCWPTRRRADKVLELMSGIGRNYPVLKKRFREVEMLDGSVEMWKHNKHPVKKLEMQIEHFQWPLDEYDCIVGIYCLCYLKDENLLISLAGMQKSVKGTGYIVLMEPVLNELNEQDDEPFKEKG